MHLPHQSHLARNYRRLDSTDQRLFNGLKKVKYPVLAIEPAESLEQKLLQFSKNEKLYRKMKQKLLIEYKLNTYRKIRGDGNCFFRALAYSLLSQSRDLSSVDETFYQLNDIKLTCCHEQSIPKEFKPFYEDNLLKTILKQNWGIDVRHYKNLYKMNNKRVLSRLFRKYPYLDFIVILYFRALCLKGLQKHKSQVKQFMKGTEQQQVRTYGQESQGVILDICSRYMKISIDVFEVRSQQLKHYSYKKSNFLPFRNSSPYQVSLLYYENHYDIIEYLTESELMKQRQDSKIKQEEYYSVINENMIDGCCIQCGREKQIYEQNSLCEECFMMSRNELLNTIKTGKMVRGSCRQCGRWDFKVLEMLQICQKCIEKQQRAQQSSMLKSPIKQNSPKKQSNIQKSSYFDSAQQEIDYCLQCDKRTVIDSETKLCFNCKSMQQYVLKREEERRKLAKCPNCKEYLDSYLHRFKCIQKITQAKIGQKNVHYSDKRCRDCNQLKITEQLNDGVCQKCQIKRKQERDKIRVENEKSRIPSQTLGARIFQNRQECKKCKKVAYVCKFQNGLCSDCKNYNQSNFRR